MVRTYGLTHIALSVRDVERSFEFYRRIFGMVAVYRKNTFIQAQTPGSRDVIVFEQGSSGAAAAGGIKHIGFRLQRPEDITEAIASIEEAGGAILDKGEFCPGEPYVFFNDPDGYQVEVWYEIPTPVDPAPVAA